jgi:hypothetical protein
LPFSAAEDLLAGGANVGKLAKLQIVGGHHSLNIPGPSVDFTPRHSSNAAAVPVPPSLDLHLPLPHQLYCIDNDSIRDKTVTMSTNNNTIINPDSKHLCYKQS